MKRAITIELNIEIDGYTTLVVLAKCTVQEQFG